MDRARPPPVLTPCGGTGACSSRVEPSLQQRASGLSSVFFALVLPTPTPISPVYCLNLASVRTHRATRLLTAGLAVGSKAAGPHPGSSLPATDLLPHPIGGAGWQHAPGEVGLPFLEVVRHPAHSPLSQALSPPVPTQLCYPTLLPSHHTHPLSPPLHFPLSLTIPPLSFVLIPTCLHVFVAPLSPYILPSFPW